MTQYITGDLVYLISPQMSLPKTSSRKSKVIYIGPLIVYKIIDTSHHILLDTEVKILNGIFHFNRLKQVYVRTTKGSVNILADLKQILNLGIWINEKDSIVWMLCEWSNFRIYL